MLSFVPPDGKFKLFEFQGARPATGQNRLLPLALKAGLIVEENGGEPIETSIVKKLTCRPILLDLII